MTDTAIPVPIDTYAFRAAARALTDSVLAIGRAAVSLTSAGRNTLMLAAAAEVAAERARLLARTYDDPAYVAGVAERLYVRAAHAPAPAIGPRPTASLVSGVMRGQVAGTRCLSIESRAQIAARIITAIGERDPAPVEALAWHRLLGATAVVVTRG